PVPVICPHAILCAIGGMAHHFQRPQVCRHKGNAGDPVREGTLRQEEIRRCFHLVLEPIAHSEHSDEVSDDDSKIERTEFHEHGDSLILLCLKSLTWLHAGSAS